MQTIDRRTLETKLDRGDDFVLLEVLPREDFDRGHIPGARHLPADEVRERAAEIVPDKSTEIVTYCSDAECELSGNAARLLTEMGYENVREYPGSKQDWKEAGLPLEAGAPVS